MNMMIAPHRFAAGGVITDPSIANVGLLAGFNGTNGATSYTADIGGAATFAGNAALSTAQVKFGTASLLLDGAGDYVDFPAAAGLQGSTGQFTVEGWMRCTGSAINNWELAGQWDSTTANVSWAFFCSGGQLYFRFYDTTNAQCDTAFYIGNAPQNTWVHYAADRDAAGVIRTYVNGVVSGNSSAHAGKTLHTSNRPVRVGAVQDYAGTYDFPGYIEEVRITKNVARYGGAFTPQSAAFPRS